MRFALKAIPIGVLGAAAALLVACGDRSGLLASSDASSLQSALSAVESACASSDPGAAAVAARRFSDQVAELSPREVDRRLIANLEQGASTLDALVAGTCTQTTTETIPTVPTTTETTPTTSTTTTTPTTTVPTTTTTAPTTPTTTEPPPTGGEESGGSGSEAETGGGGVPPGLVKKAKDTGKGKDK